jgi:hypothetical protein
MPTPFVDEPLLRSLVATLNDVFPQMRIYWSRRRLVLFFLASDQPLPLAQSAARALADSPGAFRAVGVQMPEDIEALLAFDEAGTRRLGEGAPVSTDARNLIPFRAPRALADPIRAARLEQLVAERDPLVPPPAGLDPVRLARRVLEAGDASRAARIGAASDPASRLAIEGLVALQSRDTYGGRARLREALALAPGSREASVALVRQLGPDAVPHYTVTSERAAAYPELDLVARAFGLAQRREWEALRALDAPLAAIPAADPLYPDVLRLRALWRVEAGGAAAGAEAEELIAELLPLSHFVPDVVLGTRAAAAAGRYSLALRTLDVVLAGLQPENPHNALLLPHVERALREIPSDGEHAALHQRVSDALARRRAEFGTGAVGAVGQGGR